MKVVEKDFRTFSVNSLVPGTKYQIKLTAKNKHGRSKPLYIDVETFLLPSELIAETKVKEEPLNDDSNISVVPVLVTCFVMIVIGVMVLMIFLRMRRRTNLASPVVSLTLLPKNTSTDHENLTANLDCEENFMYTSEIRTNNEVSRSFHLISAFFQTMLDDRWGKKK